MPTGPTEPGSRDSISPENFAKAWRNPFSCICIYLDMKQSAFPALSCMCGSFRRASRALTQLYEQAFRPLGLRATQFTILQVLSRAGEVSQGQLAEMLAMDSTSLTRTLGIVRRQGWIAERPGQDRRERRLRLTKAGEVQLRRALPVWETVQSGLRRRMGAQGWENVLQLTNRVTDLVKTQGGSV